MSADAFWTFHERGAFYVGWNWARFKCQEEHCGEDGRIRSNGPELGVKFSTARDRRFRLWVRAGAIAHQARFEEGPVEQPSNRQLGLELGVGSDVRITDNPLHRARGALLSLERGVGRRHRW